MLELQFQKMLVQPRIGNLNTKLLRMTSIPGIESSLEDQSGLSIDKPIALEEVHGKPSLLTHLEMMEQDQETFCLLNLKNKVTKRMNSLLVLLK